MIADHTIDRLVFRWLAIPWLQAELNAWMYRFNSSPRCADKHKLLPQGIPNIIHAKPHLYGSQDFKVHDYEVSHCRLKKKQSCQVIVSSELFDEMEQEWVQPDDPIFQLVPPSFANQVTLLYSTMGQPPVSSLTFWAVYQDLLGLFHTLPEDPQLSGALHMADEGANDEVPVLTGLRELCHGDNVVGKNGYLYYGGLENPPSLEAQGSDNKGADVENVDLQEYADFSD